MKINIIICGFYLLFAAMPLFSLAQNSPGSSYDDSRGVSSPDGWGPKPGDFELMIGGSGTSNKHLDDSLGGVNLALGHYLTSAQEILLRQSANYSNPKGSGQAWNGGTFLAFDQYLLQRTQWRPFLGAKVGGIYGDNVRDTWAAGLEGGVKYYVQPRTFIEAIAEYAWYFRHTDHFDKSFDTGQWNWGVGIGFTF